MSYNGVGLTTPRGSGTNGYIQRNLSTVRKPKKTLNEIKMEQIKPPPVQRKPNLEILEHDKKRKIELQLVLYREKLKERNYPEEEIEKKVNELRDSIKLEGSNKKDKNKKKEVWKIPTVCHPKKRSKMND